MDARFAIECVRWVMNESLRIFWTGDRESVARAIKELLKFDVPSIGVFGEIMMVQRTDLSVDEEILLLLHYGGDEGYSRRVIGESIMFKPPRITEALQRLTAPDCRQVVQLRNENYRLTDLGSRRVREQLADKLLCE